MGWTGTSGNDVYYDYTGVNDMNGGDGNDQLYGLGGNDVFHVTGAFQASTTSTAAPAITRSQ
jgi:Ca2+-binding RTX toxin-like protein